MDGANESSSKHKRSIRVRFIHKLQPYSKLNLQQYNIMTCIQYACANDTVYYIQYTIYNVYVI